MAPGARVGYTGVPLSPNGVAVDFGAAEAALLDGSLGLTDARRLEVFRQRISDEGIPTIVNMVNALDGYEEAGAVLETTEEVVLDDGTVRRDTTATVRFSKLGLIDQLFHTVASPAVTYLLLLIGMALLCSSSSPPASASPASSVRCASCWGAPGWPRCRPAGGPSPCWSPAMLAFAVDVQVGIPRSWTGIGIVLTAVGSFWLFEPIAGGTLRPSWITLLAGIGGVALAFIVGMPSMVRTRFATPTIGREWMVGELGEVIDAVDPDGVVSVRGARWRARTNRATPVASWRTGARRRHRRRHPRGRAAGGSSQRPP